MAINAEGSQDDRGVAKEGKSYIHTREGGKGGILANGEPWGDFVTYSSHGLEGINRNQPLCECGTKHGGGAWTVNRGWHNYEKGKEGKE